jgi:peptide chain release factor subunit 3
MIPIDALNDGNITKPFEACKWYKGPTLIKLLNDLPVAKPDPDGPIRIPVLDKLKDQGQFMFGKIESGTIVDG